LRGDHCSIELLVHSGLVERLWGNTNFNVSCQIIKHSCCFCSFILRSIPLSASCKIPLSSSPWVLKHNSRNPSVIWLCWSKQYIWSRILQLADKGMLLNIKLQKQQLCLIIWQDTLKLVFPHNRSTSPEWTKSSIEQWSPLKS
jgi:hypothetical protein